MAFTEETLQALAEMRAAVGRLVDGQTSDIIAAWLHTLQEVRAELDALTDSEVDRRRLLEESQRIVAERIHRVVQETNTQLTTQARLMVDNALTWQEALIGTQLPPAASGLILRPARAAIDAIVTRTVQQITVRHYYLSAEATKAVQQSLRIGITAGLNPREAAARMVQTVEGEFNGGMTRALTIARTEMLDAHRAASHATRTANKDVLAGWVWIAKLDARTCPSCIAQHGRLHDFDEPGPNDHHNGRCDALPKTRSWAELGFTGVDEPPGVDIQTGEDWFNQLPPSRQQEILGPRRYSAWQAGGYPPSAWSEKRSTEGWRDAWHTSPAPKPPTDGTLNPGPKPRTPGPDWSQLNARQTQDALTKAMKGRGTVSGLHLLPDSVARDTARTLHDLLHQHPYIDTDIVVAPIQGGRTLAAASARAGFPTPEAKAAGKRDYSRFQITIDPRKATTGNETLRRNVEARWWAARPETAEQISTARYVLTHEFGHLIDYAGGMGQHRPALLTAARNTPHLQLMRDMMKKEGVTGIKTAEAQAWFNRNISRYGQTSRAETLAEAFADVTLNGDKASPLSKAIHREMIDAAKRREGRWKP